MAAASVNPFDNTVRRGWVPQVAAGLIQGNEGAGVVIGSGSESLPPGTRVMLMGAYGFARSGTWQEQVTAGPTEATKVPDNLTDVEAAAVPVAYIAAQLALTRAVRFEPGMTLLIPVSVVGSAMPRSSWRRPRASVASSPRRVGRTRRSMLAILATKT